MVLGGGIVLWSVGLIAWDPGIGKSTLLLQMAINVSKGKFSNNSNERQIDSNKLDKNSIPFENSPSKVLYISGEESVEQIKMRADRITDTRKLSDLLLVSLTNADAIPEIVEKTKPDLVIIDSIQTMESAEAGGLSGAVGQVRYCTSMFVKLAKTMGVPFLIVGHVTKEGMVAGPMMLSHMVDTVLFLEGEKFTSTRILRSLKNRFGPVDEVGVFVMDEKGMSEVRNPEQIFLSGKKEDTAGSVLVVIMEGTRPFLIEVQALVVYSKFPMPRRVTSGVDSKRVELLLAVLQKHCRLPVETMDVFVNIAGGMRVDDPAVNLGICLAVYSSLKNKPLSQTVCIGEVGLLGELRMVTGLEKRLKEAGKLGFTKVVSPKEFRTLNGVLQSLA